MLPSQRERVSPVQINLLQRVFERLTLEIPLLPIAPKIMRKTIETVLYYIFNSAPRKITVLTY